MGQNAGRRAPSFSDFFDGRQARAVWSRRYIRFMVRYIPRKLEQRRIPAKNAATPHLNAMGIAPKVVEGTLLQPLTLMFRTNASQTASQIPWVMKFEKQLCSNPVLHPGRPTRLFSLFRLQNVQLKCVIDADAISLIP